jgi:LmbE family N-acetylglucosaminyl deacetylase
MRLSLTGDEGPLCRLLLIGAHADDIEIGCGGTIMRLLKAKPNLSVCWVVMSAQGERVAEARRSAETILAEVGEQEIHIGSFRDGFLPYQGGEVKEYFEGLKKTYDPDLILTHFGRDAHQDHRLISELTWNTFRDHFILEFEIPKYDGDLGAPNFFVQLDVGLAKQKVDHLLSQFGSQRNKHWFTEDVFLSLMRLRGMECNAPSRYAEAFYCRKAIT